MSEEENREYEAIRQARAKLKAFKDPIKKACPVTTLAGDVPDAKTLAAGSVVTSLDILSGYFPLRIKNDQDYRALLMAAIAIIDPASEFHLEVPAHSRGQDIGINYKNIVGSDPVIENGLALMTKHVTSAETDKNSFRTSDRIDAAISTIFQMAATRAKEPPPRA